MVPSCLLTKILFILLESVVHHRHVLTEDVRIHLSCILFAMGLLLFLFCFAIGFCLGVFFLSFSFFSLIFYFGSNTIPTPHHTSPHNYHFLNVDINLRPRKTYIHLHMWKCVCSIERWGGFFLYQSCQVYHFHCITTSVFSP